MMISISSINAEALHIKTISTIPIECEQSELNSKDQAEKC